MRQFLADKAMGNLAGIWLLVPELLRLGVWDLICGWTGQRPERVGPRLALQLIHEAALCRTGLRHRRTLNQRIFELANGLPFLASDMAVHELLAGRTVDDSLNLQVALGKLRRASGHFQGRLLAIDPHRVRSFSKRHMRLHRHDNRERAFKTAQTFFALDADTGQPICFTTGTSARTAAAAAEELLKLASDIFNPEPGQILVLADAEHFTVELLDRVKSATKFDLLVPMVNRPDLLAKLRRLPPELFQPRWAGYATAKVVHASRQHAGPFYQYVQREGERLRSTASPLSSRLRDGDEVEELAGEFSSDGSRGGILQRSSGPGMESCRDVQSQHSIWPDDDGATRPSGDHSVFANGLPCPRRTGMPSTWPRPTLEVWRETLGSLTGIEFSLHITTPLTPTDSERNTRTCRPSCGQRTSTRACRGALLISI